ncbi:hypothetical protein Mapa_004878 [Marchantia paleacea]|nr:hypothetical protein Mapa_004878 [Marchantia paleacea]
MAKHSLTRPLLDNDDQPPVLPPSTYNASESQRLAEEPKEEFKTWLVEELTHQFWLAGPMILVNLLQYLLNVVSVMFVGHLGELALASSSIATSLAGVTGYHVMMGLASALETLCGQAFGAKEYRLSGIFLQRAIFVLTLCAFPITFVWWNMGPILKFIGQDPAISDGAMEYSRFLIPSLFAYAFLQPLVKFLQTQSAVNAMAMFSGVTLLFHAPLCYLLVFYFGIGFRGAAIANSISQWLNVVFLALYVRFSPTCKKTWTGFSSEALQDIGDFLKLAVPSTVMVCLEYWCFESIVLLSGLLPNPKLETSALAICLNTIALMYMVPFGLSAAVSTRVSNELGAGRPYAAKAAVKLTVSLALMEGCLMSILLISVRSIWPYLYSGDAEVVNYVSKMVPFLATLAILDGFQGTLCGVARGCGWQHLGAYTNLGAFYVVGIPTALLMAFHFHLNGYGLWIGIICGLVTQAFLLAIITLTLNWQKLADEATDRVHHTHAAGEVLPKHVQKVDHSQLTQ